MVEWGNQINQTIRFLRKIRKRVNYTLENCSEGEKILVVGGGDSAIEYAIELSQKNDVTICYRRETFRRANPVNQRDIANAIAHNELKAYLGTNIKGLEDDNGRVKVIFQEREPETFDRVIYAIGGTTPTAFLQSSGIKMVNGRPYYDDNYMTNIEGVYVAGDITQESGGSIALGLNHGYHIAKDILSKLKADELSSAHLIE